MEKHLHFYQGFYIVIVQFYGKDKRKQNAKQSVFLYRRTADADTWHGGAGGILGRRGFHGASAAFKGIWRQAQDRRQGRSRASWDPGRECRQGSGILCKVLSGERNSSSDLPEGCTGLCIDSSYESGRSGTRSTV